MHVDHTKPKLHILPEVVRNTIDCIPYNSIYFILLLVIVLPEDEPSVSKHVEDIKIKNYSINL
jgi:hypothetical protein